MISEWRIFNESHLLPLHTKKWHIKTLRSRAFLLYAKGENRMSDQLNLDSGMLQYVPKGAYYEGADEQFDIVMRMWKDLFEHDRTLFCLTSLLGGTGFSKGAILSQKSGSVQPIHP